MIDTRQGREIFRLHAHGASRTDIMSKLSQPEHIVCGCILELKQTYGVSTDARLALVYFALIGPERRLKWRDQNASYLQFVKTLTRSQRELFDLLGQSPMYSDMTSEAIGKLLGKTEGATSRTYGEIRNQLGLNRRMAREPLKVKITIFAALVFGMDDNGALLPEWRCAGERISV